jgi:structure-specific recognition protein 1
LKASEGFLYPLERCLIFIHKPVVYIPLDAIKNVEFSRVTDPNLHRSFDIKVNTKNDEHQFLGLDRAEYDSLIQYFTAKKVKISNEEGMEIDTSVKQVKY